MREQTDYVGNMIYENNALKRILVDGGYIEDGAYYFYETDHLGNNRMVLNEFGFPSQTNDYYPYGMSFADGMERSKQPYKYNGKEFDAERDLNLYDYSARFMDPALGRFTTPDPLAEKYYSTSPYAYCAGNPINRFDPTGLAWKATYTENNDGSRTYNGYKWIQEDKSYDTNGNLLQGLYSQAIFFSDNGTFNTSKKKNLGSSTATVYLADGTTTTFDASTNPSNDCFSIVPEGTYNALVGLHRGRYLILKRRDIGATL